MHRGSCQGHMASGQPKPTGEEAPTHSSQEGSCHQRPGLVCIPRGFMESFNENLLPTLIAEYGASLTDVQFYEDHLASGLRIGGEFFYPLTVVVDGEPEVRTVKWQVSNYRLYDNMLSRRNGKREGKITFPCKQVLVKPCYSKNGSKRKYRDSAQNVQNDRSDQKTSVRLCNKTVPLNIEKL